MREASKQLGLDIKIYGPENYITAVVPLWHWVLPIPTTFQNLMTNATTPSQLYGKKYRNAPKAKGGPRKVENFTARTRCIV
jgi:hypothetical protein